MVEREVRRPAGGQRQRAPASRVRALAGIAAVVAALLAGPVARAQTQSGSPGAAPALVQPPSAAERIRAEGAWARPAQATGAHHGPAMGVTSAVFLTLINDSSSSGYLVAVRSDVADAVEIHETSLVDGVMRMAPVQRIEVPARGQVQLRPGGYHIMLLGLRRALQEGDRFRVALVFDDGSELALDVQVEMR